METLFDHGSARRYHHKALCQRYPDSENDGSFLRNGCFVCPSSAVCLCLACTASSPPASGLNHAACDSACDFCLRHIPSSACTPLIRGLSAHNTDSAMKSCRERLPAGQQQDSREKQPCPLPPQPDSASVPLSPRTARPFVPSWGTDASCTPGSMPLPLMRCRRGSGA